MKYGIALLASLLLLPGCEMIGAAGQDDFADEMNRLAPPGTDYNLAVQRIMDKGYSCDAATATQPTTCHKTNDMAIYHCVKTVKLYTNNANSNIVQAQINRPDCSPF